MVTFRNRHHGGGADQIRLGLLYEAGEYRDDDEAVGQRHDSQTQCI